MPRAYRSERRAAAAEGTRQAILGSARRLVREGGAGPSVGAIAAGAGVSRLSVYHHFGSRSGVLAALAVETRAPSPAAGVRDVLAGAAAHWAADTRLYRQLPAAAALPAEPLRQLVASLATEDRLRPGCSIKEAEDVLLLLTSFPTFDRLHQDGRRSVQAVTEILMRMAGAILNRPT